MRYWMLGPILATIFILWFMIHDIIGVWPDWVKRFLDWKPFKRNKR